MLFSLFGPIVPDAKIPNRDREGCISIKENIGDGDHDDDAYYDYDDDETNKSNSKIYLPENMEVNG